MNGRPSVGRVLGLPDRPSGMIGRDALLRALFQALDPGAVVALRGPAGAGKTWVAREYAHRMATLYDTVWWVDAGEPEQIPERLAELARELGLSKPGDPAEEATEILLEHLRGRGRWLLIFDDAGAPGQLAGFAPGAGGHVVVTSRHPGWPGAPGSLELLPLDQADVVRLLRSTVPDLSTEDAERIAGAVGGRPVDVCQAGAALTHGRQSAALYVRDLARATPDGREAGEAVWHVAFDRFQGRRFDAGAFELLTLMAWLSPEPIPRDWLTEYAANLPGPLRKIAGVPRDLERAAAELRERGLADEDEGGLRMAWRPAALLRARTVQLRPVDGRSWAELVARMLLTAARQRRAAWPDDAFVLLARVFGYCSEVLGDDHPVALDAVADLASLARTRGDEAGAATLLAWLEERRKAREQEQVRIREEERQRLAQALYYRI